MPFTVWGNTTNSVQRTSSHALRNKDLGYSYPDGLNLRPGYELHEMIKSEILQRAQESYLAMSSRYDDWKIMDRMLTSYISPDLRQRLEPKADPQANVESELEKDIRIIVPVMFAQLDVLMTYTIAALLENPILRFNPTNGADVKDIVGVAILEALIDKQLRYTKAVLPLHTMFRDAFAYGIGGVSLEWHKEMGMRSVLKQSTRLRLLGMEYEEVTEEVDEEYVQFEGNRLNEIDPYMMLPDPNFPIHRIQESEFFGWMTRDSQHGLLRREAMSDGRMFNARYLKELGDSRSTMYESSFGQTGRDKTAIKTGETTSMGTVRPADIIYMYIDIIPNEWGLGPRTTPEKWAFGLAGEEIVIQARPLGLKHNKFPVAVCSPDFDGHSITPMSRLEILVGMQDVVDFMVSSHVENVKKTINDMIVYDPTVIESSDIENPKPGKLIRMRRNHWGDFKASDAVHQFSVQDVTKQHMVDVGFITQLIEKIGGGPESLQGIMRQGGERRSATEFRGTKSSALGRQERLARVIAVMALQDIGHMCVQHTQQLLTGSTYLQAVGQWPQKLAMEYGLDPRQLEATRRSVQVPYDMNVSDGTMPSGEYADSWIQVFQILTQSPELSSQYNMGQIFMHLARLMGAKNVSTFLNNVRVEAMDNEQVEREVDRGNLTTMPAGGNGNGIPLYS